MPWKVSEPVTERMKFVSRILDGERMTDRVLSVAVRNRLFLQAPRLSEAPDLVTLASASV